MSEEPNELDKELENVPEVQEPEEYPDYPEDFSSSYFYEDSDFEDSDFEDEESDE